MDVLGARAALYLQRVLLITALMLMPQVSIGTETEAVDYLSFAQGAVPVAVGGMATPLQVGIEAALAAIDGNSGDYGVTPKPGGADTEVTFLYKLPARTIFTTFAVPTVLETPSPSQTFFRDITIAGSDHGPDGPFATLAAVTLTAHASPGQVTRFPAAPGKPVRWVQLSLHGGLDIQRAQTFFEFSEIIGWGSQEQVPQLDTFTGKWKGSGVVLELKQDGATVSGCYDRVGDLSGTVSGNILRATGTQRDSGIPSTFVLTVTDDGTITGVRSTNGAPFRLYTGATAPALQTTCSASRPQPPGCGAILHGIQFDYDSATIRPESQAVLDALCAGLRTTPGAMITIVGHTSSEGAETYNQDLSQRRAAAVVAALTARGLEAARLASRGAGEERPIADNTTEAGRSLNRRVEIECH